MLKATIHRAQWIFHSPNVEQLQAFNRGALVLDQNGRILDCTDYSVIRKKYPKAKCIDHGLDSIILPGFVDAHVHAPQLEMVASFGSSLLDWLERYTFPTEEAYESATHARKQYSAFANSLLAKGTTTAAVYGTSHVATSDLLLKALDASGIRAFAGPSLMDRNAPTSLLVSSEKALENLERLILKWRRHAKVRASLVLRFAPTSTEALLKGAAGVLEKYPDVLMQTHLSETLKEVAWVKELFPKFETYSQVYDQYGLLTARSVLGHGIYISESERALICRRQAKIAHCPTSNMFLGSGLFGLRAAEAAGVQVGLGSDVGGGWSLSLFTTAAAAYQVAALRGQFLNAGHLLYLMTKGGAITLGLNDVGDFSKGAVGDFVVLDTSTVLGLKDRLQHTTNADEVLGALIFLAGSSQVSKLYLDGNLKHSVKTKRAHR